MSAARTGFASLESTMTAPRFQSFADFFPFYLAEHSNSTSRALHYIGTTLGTLVFVYALSTQRWPLLIAYPIIGYRFAWVGHFVFEKNRPATFTYPVWSLMGDYRMLGLALTGRLRQPLADGIARYGRAA